jgi:YggT family protein
MMTLRSALLVCLAVAFLIVGSDASVILPPTLAGKSATNAVLSTMTSADARRASSFQKIALSRRRRMGGEAGGAVAVGGSNAPLAMAIPGYGVAEQVFVGGFANFLQIYNYVITARILLSWFPQAQGIGALQPVFAITDPYLNLFRGIIPPVFGLDLSPILAFFTLNVLSSTTASIGMEMKKTQKVNADAAGKKSRRFFGMRMN